MAAVKFDSKCKTCNAKVAKGTGDVRKGTDGKWAITCNTHKPAARPVSSWTRQVRMISPEGQEVYVNADDAYDAQKDGYRRG